jgi:hypothetical protein
MPDPMQLDPDRIRVVLDHGEAVELDGGTLVLDGQESPSVVLRLAPWRARSLARVLQEWSSVSRIFHHTARPHLDELELSRTLELAAVVLGVGEEPIVRSPHGRASFPIDNAWPLSQFWASVSRIYPRWNALPWSMPPRGGTLNRTAAKNLLTHCLLRVVQRRSPRNGFTRP